MIQYKEWHDVDKSKWASGPWTHEPDRVQWQDEETGLPCLAVRASLGGNWCGYVGVSAGHPAYERPYTEVPVAVYGGLTYAAHCVGRICHETDDHDSVWWLGFDCAHSGDLLPSANKAPFSYPWDISYKPLSYVKSQCARLADQLADVTMEES